MERAVVLTQGGGQPQASPALGDLVAQYSTILASQVNLLRHLHHVETRVHCPQTCLSLYFQCRDNVSELI